MSTVPHLFFVVTDRDCHCRWCREFVVGMGCDHAPIISPKPQALPGLEGRFVFADLGRLRPDQIDRSIAQIAARSCWDEAEIRREVTGDHGLPIAIGSCRVICTDVEQGRRVIRMARPELRMGRSRP